MTIGRDRPLGVATAADCQFLGKDLRCKVVAFSLMARASRLLVRPIVDS